MIELRPMTRELNREMFSSWENDPAIYADMSLFEPYVYSEEAADAFFEKKARPDRVSFAIMLDGRVIGGVTLKHIDTAQRECELSIHLVNDSVKGRGYGTQAEKLAVRYAFDTLGMRAVNADTILKNTRSAHVLEKAGFSFVKEDAGFRYYRIEKADV